MDKDREGLTKKDLEREERDMEMVQDDIAADKELRKNINLFVDKEAIDDLTNQLGGVALAEQDSENDINIHELLDEMQIKDEDEAERKSSIDVIKDKSTEQLDKNKKQIGKRERTGKQIEDEI